ncbi:MAG: large conductance mechanosensitive channel protein MscL [Propionibacteriaceae bacterium]|nr:large conductance mechanosensitive channel protein MscL [Propionibacteriaceae bacterium]
MGGFKDFIMKGNLIELATAFIMGTAFAEVVSSFAQLLMDLIGKVLPVDLDGGSFSSTAIAGVNVGAFLAALVSFLLIAFVLYFAIVKPYESYKKMRGVEAESGATDTELLTEIRDLLAGR